MAKSPAEYYRNEEWFEYADRVMQRDGYRCMACGRGISDGIVLQVHHEQYLPDRKPWEYPLSVCTTLCKGCHAREHDLLPPSSGWVLVSSTDLGDLLGTCERPRGKSICGMAIRYEHLIYHPTWGEMTVGSTCVEFLTEEVRALINRKKILYQQTRDFVFKKEWLQSTALDYRGARSEAASYKNHHVIVHQVPCGSAERVLIQLSIKHKGIKVRQVKQELLLPRKVKYESAKELGYIWLRGELEQDERRTDELREAYRLTLQSIK